MDAAQRIAFVTAQAIAAEIEMVSMRAANAERESNGFSPAYGEKAFIDLIDKYGLSHNALIVTLTGHT